MPRLTQVAHEVLAASLQDGDLAIDATAGNGHDTLWLARWVGPKGHVLAIDRQPYALAKTRERLTQANVASQVTLVEGDHARLLELTPRPWWGQVSAIVFNLGYLPGSDKQVMTTASSTRSALDASATLLKPGGLLSVLIYRGHTGGQDEAAMIQDWLGAQHNLFSRVSWYDGDFPKDTSPRLMTAQKR